MQNNVIYINLIFDAYSPFTVFPTFSRTNPNCPKILLEMKLLHFDGTFCHREKSFRHHR